MTAINRRRALSGSAAVALGVPLLAACGGDSGSTGPTATATATGSATDGASPSGVGASGEVLASLSDVPVGGCFVVAASKVVVTQATAGEFKAFSSTCTHQGCQVESSTEGDIPCPCHGSKFSLDDGSPIAGPAGTPLAPVDITVDGDTISIA